MRSNLNAIALDIVNFKNNHSSLKKVIDSEEMYNYLIWCIVRHIDFSLDKYRVDDDFLVGYWDMYLLYKELCKVCNIEMKLGYFCVNSTSLQDVANTLKLGNLYLFYLWNLDINYEFSDLCLDVVRQFKPYI